MGQVNSTLIQRCGYGAPQLNSSSIKPEHYVRLKLAELTSSCDTALVFYHHRQCFHTCGTYEYNT